MRLKLKTIIYSIYVSVSVIFFLIALFDFINHWPVDEHYLFVLCISIFYLFSAILIILNKDL